VERLGLMPLRASVIVCTESESRWWSLLDALASLRQQSVPPEEIVVAIDHNPDLLERVTGQIRDVSVVPNLQAPGLSGSRNSGVARCRGEIVTFIDDDAAAAPDWLEQLLQAYAAPHVAGVGGRIDPIWEAGRPGWFPPEFAWVVGCSYAGLPATTAPVRNLIGCNMSFRRDVLAEAGGFRSGFGQSSGVPLRRCEETELCIRIRQRWPDCELRYEPRALVRHRVPPERSRVRYFAHRCYSEGLSKAQVAGALGRRDGLASERRYVRSTLPSGIRRELTPGATARKIDGLGRAAAMTSGLLLAAAGYYVGLRSAAGRESGPFTSDQELQS
jgi:glycosyltransferase involved in cell wall biosynthesis